MIRGRDFLLVERFLEGEVDEPFVRTRIGRLYYAAYLEARHLCETALGYERTRLGREHQEVARLIASLDREVSSQLRFLRNYRNAADYDLGLSTETIRLNLRDALTLSHDIIARLDELTEFPVPLPR